MSTGKHTPGTWIAKRMRNGETNGDFDIDSVSGHFIAESIGGMDIEEEEANAHLIAAAPELLDALKQIERLSREADSNLVDVRAMLGDIARDAIAKAEGES